ncbi:membrane protein insertase YidC [Legionella impletisoli]|uniref:Membrane protein insertase YidC n=1 Tax=Legionella impletisoli TaxID=343510 RepID=A0A917JXI3_9GAMM|nr:membrane protein insertase YidC [Legionella impletisoli]GGI86987.1 membrane protein insertase YidC [Legionella impletisoli]
MDTRRFILYAALALVVYLLWTSWQADYPPPAAVTQTAMSGAAKPQAADDRLLPKMSPHQEEPVAPTESSPVETKSVKDISVKTDVLDLEIDLKHGDIVQAKLLDYPVSVEEDRPITLLQDNKNEQYVANSSLFVVRGHEVDNLDFNFTAEKDFYQLASDEKKLTVTLNGQANGLHAKKEFIFTKGSYLIEVRYHLTNEEDSPWKGHMNAQLLRSSPKEDKSSIFHIGSYTGASYSVPGQHRYQKVPFSNMAKSNLDVKSEGGWVAMQQHYFLSAWIPLVDTTNRFYTRSLDNDYTIGMVTKPIVVSPNETETVGANLYVGPELDDQLSAAAPSLDLTIDYGWLWFLSSFLFWIMKGIHSVVGNWGWTIVLVTVLIKLAFYRLSATSYKSMAAMRKLQPKLQALRERFGDDKAKISQATMELYRQEKVNPLGGCLPILIQIPVFIALYWVLLESVQLRQAPFIFWIHDLASADPYHVLPIIMGATMLIQQKLNPAPPDPTQAKVMMFLPILFTALFWNFPAGLVLYWIVNNTLSILQQWYITRKYSDEKPNNKKLAAANK